MDIFRIMYPGTSVNTVPCKKDSFSMPHTYLIHPSIFEERNHQFLLKYLELKMKFIFFPPWTIKTQLHILHLIMYVLTICRKVLKNTELSDNYLTLANLVHKFGIIFIVEAFKIWNKLRFIRWNIFLLTTYFIDCKFKTSLLNNYHSETHPKLIS